MSSSIALGTLHTLATACSQHGRIVVPLERKECSENRTACADKHANGEVVAVLLPTHPLGTFSSGQFRGHPSYSIVMETYLVNYAVPNLRRLYGEGRVKHNDLAQIMVKR